MYRDRPWLSLYPAGTPADLAVGYRDAVSMWRASVARNGGAPMIHYFDSTYTQTDVDSASDALAVGLAERGITPGDRVAMYLQNVPQFVVGLLAIWKLGAIAVPINPMMKERELAYLLNDSGAQALICLDELWNAVAAKAVADTSVTTTVATSALDYLTGETPQALRGVQRLHTEGAIDLLTLVRQYSGRQPDPVVRSPDEVALLTYTSGTTGEPKAAMNTHRNVVFNAHGYRAWIGLSGDDVCLAGAPLFHITGLIAYLAVAMLVPMPLVLGYRFDAARMNELAEKHRATYTVMAITAYTAMMNDPAIRDRDLSALSKVYSCGAPVPPSIVARFQREVGPYIHNTYGLTETSAPSHAVPYGRPAPVDPTSGALSIGVPLYHNVVRIVDDNGDDVPVGALGEIAVRGPEVVPGYWQRPEATAATFPDGELRTGDIGFMDRDGWFYLVDRKKDLIIASGYKVWPREVEDVLLEHPAVAEAAVVGVLDGYRGETVKAYVSLRPGHTVAPADLIGFCRERMAAYKYPRQLDIVDELPKTLTGKVLRRELRTWSTPSR
jgi:long-chain acyl-CoA synthetase